MQNTKIKTQTNNIKHTLKRPALPLVREHQFLNNNRASSSSSHVLSTQAQICISSSKINLQTMHINNKTPQEWETDNQSSSSNHRQELAWLLVTQASTICLPLDKLYVLVLQEAISSSHHLLQTVLRASRVTMLLVISNPFNIKVNSQIAKALFNKTMHKLPICAVLVDLQEVAFSNSKHPRLRKRWAEAFQQTNEINYL